MKSNSSRSASKGQKKSVQKVDYSIEEYLHLISTNQEVLFDLLGLIVKQMTGKIPVVAWREYKDGAISTTYVTPTLEHVILHQEESHSPSLK